MSWQELRRKWEQQPEYLEALDRELPFRDISTAVVGLRVENGITQSELAELAHTTQSVISRMESGRHSFEIALLTRISRALNTTWRPVFEPVGAVDLIVVASTTGPANSYRVEMKAVGETPVIVYTPLGTDHAVFNSAVGGVEPDYLDRGRPLSA